MAKLIAVLDTNENNTCDDCGAKLRYEYHTSDGGRYGSECVHRHIHAPDWITFKAKADAKMFAEIGKRAKDMASDMSREVAGILYVPEVPHLRGVWVNYTHSRLDKLAAPQAVNILLGMGWRMEEAHRYTDNEPEKFYLVRSD